jgi:hypothetical protein
MLHGHQPTIHVRFYVELLARKAGRISDGILEVLVIISPAVDALISPLIVLCPPGSLVPSPL